MQLLRRPSSTSLESAYDDLFRSTWDKLKDSALHGRLFADGRYDDLEGVPGRSMAWKLFLTHQPPLTHSLNRHPVPPLDALRHSRKRYASQLEDKMRAPDGSHVENTWLPRKAPHEQSFTIGSPVVPDQSGDLTRNNPLSLDSSSPWHAYFSALDLRETIRQDVERTFPDIEYFRSLKVQSEITNILFLHVSERENIGYRQGMHELVACFYQVVDFDSIERTEENVPPELKELCDRDFVAADVFALFGVLMERMESWYEWRPSIIHVSPTSPVSYVPHFSANGELVSKPNPRPQVNVLENGQLDLKPYVAPIVATCASLRDEKLKAVDPHLWEKLRDCGVEPQLYGIRWLRLLFTREFSLAESMILWDGLFASVCDGQTSSSSSSSQGFELALWISIAMLIRIRNSLIPGDYTTQLTHLLRYPTPSVPDATSNTSNAPALLLSQAQQLKISPSPATGASLVLQNRNELGIPAEVPNAPSPSSPTRRRRPATAAATPTATESLSKTVNSRDRTRLQEIISTRLNDANESLGIQRGFLNTITEIRKSLPDLPQSLIRTSSWSSPANSWTDEPGASRSSRSPTIVPQEIPERPPWEPKPRSEVEREMAELRALLKTLGNAIGWAVDVLLLDEESQEQPKEGEMSLKEKKMEALECMAYVRDVLARGGQGEIDEERLVSEEEYNRQRRIKREKEQAASTANRPARIVIKPMTPPPRVASPLDPPDKVNKHRTVSSSGDSTRPLASLTRIPFAPRETTSISARPSSSAGSSQISNMPNTPTVSAASDARMAMPPWQHTPSGFSDSSPYASGKLPRLPPPSTAAPSRHDRRPSDHSLPRDTLKTDPLGVLRREQ